jgi:nucleoside 2-deoxyribosyltransferase
MTKVFIIGAIRGAGEEARKKMESYAAKLEEAGYHVHLPHRDTNQDACGFDICQHNLTAITWSDEVHVFYDSTSQGTHFDLGMAFALKRKIVPVENEHFDEQKSFPRMLYEWSLWDAKRCTK